MPSTEKKGSCDLGLIVGICAMVVQLGVVGPVVKRFGERLALIAGLSFGTIGFLITGLNEPV